MTNKKAEKNEVNFLSLLHFLIVGALLAEIPVRLDTTVPEKTTKHQILKQYYNYITNRIIACKMPSKMVFLN